MELIGLKKLWENVWVRLVAFCAAITLAVLTIYYARDVFWPFVLSFIIAYILDPVVDFFEARRIPRVGGIVIIIIVILLVLTLFLLLLVPMLIEQINILVGYISRIANGFNNEWIPWIEKAFNVTFPKTSKGLIDQLKSNLDVVQRVSVSSFSPAAYIVSTVFTSAYSAIIAIINIFVIPVVTFYLLRDYDRIISTAKKYIPPKHKKIVLQRAGEIDEVLSSFIRGQFTVCCILGCLYSLGLLIAGIPLWALVGIFAGAVSFIPYLGFMAGIGPSILLAIMEYSDIRHIIYVIISFTVVQTLEGTVITPNIVGEKLGLHPVTIMFALLFGGHFFGFIGILLAIPVTAILNVFIRASKERYLASKFYNDPEMIEGSQ